MATPASRKVRVPAPPVSCWSRGPTRNAAAPGLGLWLAPDEVHLSDGVVAEETRPSSPNVRRRQPSARGRVQHSRASAESRAALSSSLLPLRPLRSLSASAVALTALAAPTAASAHATVEPLDPARPQAGSSVSFVLDAPNEELTAPGTKVVLFIPLGAQAHVSARRTRGLTLDARHRAAGRRDTARSTTTRLTWTARPGHAVEPGETQRFRFRLRAPSRPGPLCFKIDQHFSPSVLGERPKADRWRGPVRSRRPASCVQIAAPSLRP